MIYCDYLGKVGRLGNALFEIAGTLGVAARRGDAARFNADWMHRPYFSVPPMFFVDDFIGGTQASHLVPHIDRRVAVHLQDVNLFWHMMPTIRGYLAPSESAQEILRGQTDFHQLQRPILSVHVRRGDNVLDPGVPNKQDYFILPSLLYYKTAIGMMSKGVGSVAVFSDDPEWCEQNLDADYFHHGVTRPKEHEPDYLTAPVLDWVDLQLMAQCDRHVVTGSTFGIWGALLAPDTNVIRPHRVYGPMLSYIDSSLLFPSSWQILDQE